MPSDNARALEITSNITDMEGLIRPGRKPKSIDFYVYNAAIEGLTAVVTTGSTVVQTQSDSDFIHCFSSAGIGVDGGSAVGTNNRAFVQMTDLSDGKTYYSSPAYINTAFGYGGFPYVLPAPRVWKPNTNIRIDISDVLVGATSTAYFSFSGMRIYYD